MKLIEKSAFQAGEGMEWELTPPTRGFLRKVFIYRALKSFNHDISTFLYSHVLV